MGVQNLAATSTLNSVALGSACDPIPRTTTSEDWFLRFSDTSIRVPAATRVPLDTEDGSDIRSASMSTPVCPRVGIGDRTRCAREEHSRLLASTAHASSPSKRPRPRTITHDWTYGFYIYPSTHPSGVSSDNTGTIERWHRAGDAQLSLHESAEERSLSVRTIAVMDATVSNRITTAVYHSNLGVSVHCRELSILVRDLVHPPPPWHAWCEGCGFFGNEGWDVGSNALYCRSVLRPLIVISKPWSVGRELSLPGVLANRPVSATSPDSSRTRTTRKMHRYPRAQIAV